MIETKGQIHSTKTLFFMGIQHVFVMFGATVLLPILTGLDISVTLFASGIGTFLFHLVTKGKVPVFLGSSFAFLAPILAIATTEGLPYALGGIVISGMVYLCVAGLLHFISPSTILKYIPSHISGTIIVLI